MHPENEKSTALFEHLCLLYGDHSYFHKNQGDCSEMNKSRSNATLSEIRPKGHAVLFGYLSVHAPDSSNTHPISRDPQSFQIGTCSWQYRATMRKRQYDDKPPVYAVNNPLSSRNCFKTKTSGRTMGISCAEVCLSRL